MVSPSPEEKACPQRARHTKAPEGYIAWHTWAADKARTHTQKRCPGCGLFTIWVRKKPRKRLREGAA